MIMLTELCTRVVPLNVAWTYFIHLFRVMMLLLFGGS